MFAWWVITPWVIQARLTPSSSCQVSGEIPVVALVRRIRTTCGRATKAPVTAPIQPRMSTNTIKDLLQLNAAAHVNQEVRRDKVTSLRGPPLDRRTEKSVLHSSLFFSPLSRGITSGPAVPAV